MAGFTTKYSSHVESLRCEHLVDDRGLGLRGGYVAGWDTGSSS